MRVALDTSAVPNQPAGAGRYVVELARRLPSRGIDTTLVTRRGDEERWHRYSPDARVSPLVPRARAARLLFEATRLGRTSVARDVDVWHGPHYTMPRRGSTPCVVTIHDMTFFTNPEWHERAKVLFFRRAIDYAARHARAIVSVSEYTARLIDELLEGHAPVIVAPLGVDLDRFGLDATGDERVMTRYGLRTDVEYFLFVGTFEPRKGIDVLLDAFSEVARENPRVELWLAGQHGWGISDVEAGLTTHAAAARIRRLGFVPDDALAPLLRGSRAAVYPSRGVRITRARGAGVRGAGGDHAGHGDGGGRRQRGHADDRRIGERPGRGDALAARTHQRRARARRSGGTRPRRGLHLGALRRSAPGRLPSCTRRMTCAH